MVKNIINLDSKATEPRADYLRNINPTTVKSPESTESKEVTPVDPFTYAQVDETNFPIPGFEDMAVPESKREVGHRFNIGPYGEGFNSLLNEGEEKFKTDLLVENFMNDGHGLYEVMVISKEGEIKNPYSRDTKPSPKNGSEIEKGEVVFLKRINVDKAVETPGYHVLKGRDYEVVSREEFMENYQKAVDAKPDVYPPLPDPNQPEPRQESNIPNLGEIWNNFWDNTFGKWF